MIKIPIMEEESKKKQMATKYIISDTTGLDGAELIPIDLGGHLVPQNISINKLGKQLLKAASEGDAEEIKRLVGKGVPFTADWLGTSPLHLAAQNNHLEVCEILLRAGISRDARTKVDRTPLHMAAYEGHVEIVETLLRNGADCDSRDLLYMTPLHWAAQNGHADVVSLLIRYGASTNLVNKFELTPADIAAQIKRQDIIEIINKEMPDPDVTAQQMSIDINSDSDSNIDQIKEQIDALSNSPMIPLETVLQEDSENSIDPETLHINPDADVNDSSDNSYAESFKLLQQHGITMLPTDDNNILSSVMENGHSVVLTEIGKEVLNSVKPIEVQQVNLPTVKTIKLNNTKKKFINLNPQGLLTMSCTNGIPIQGNILKQINGKIFATTRPTVKKIVMTKNKTNPISPTVTKIAKNKLPPPNTDMETVMKQLIEARKLVEEYKQKLMKKEAEAESYKQQLKLLMEAKT